MSAPTSAPARTRLIVALDTAEAAEALEWTRRLRGRVRIFKVGLQLFIAAGPGIVGAVREAGGGEVFLDLKLHDIPNTVAGAVRAAAASGARWLTVHAGGGRAMLEAAVTAAGGRIGLLGVTVLTSLDAAQMEQLGMPGTITARVERWADLCAAAGLAGVVASPQEAAGLRRRLPSGFLIVTPGIRGSGDAVGDQARVATPAAALRAGADYLVVGRPITAAADPAAAAAAMGAEMDAAVPGAAGS